MSKRHEIQSRSETIYESARFRVVLRTGPAKRGISAILSAYILSPQGLTTSTTVLATDTQSRARAGQRSIDLLHRLARDAAVTRIRPILAQIAADPDSQKDLFP